MTNEFDLIDRIRRRAARRTDVLLGIGDDCALLKVPAGQALAVSTDALNLGVHFSTETPPADLGYKALAVNLSDLAAMGATPAWASLSLSLPQADSNWLDGFLDGFLALAAEHQVALVGGDTTRGPLSIVLTVHGFVPLQQALRRDAAQVGDAVWVTGTLGDAAAGLALESNVAQALAAAPESRAFLLQRLRRPTPRVHAGIALRGLAHAAIDVSDGLLADLGHVLEASAVGALIDLAHLPTSHALAEYANDASRRWNLQCGGGDDYELCFTAPAHASTQIEARCAAAATRVTRIGRICAERGCRLQQSDGTAWLPPRHGFDHFCETNK